MMSRASKVVPVNGLYRQNELCEEDFRHRTGRVQGDQCRNSSGLHCQATIGRQAAVQRSCRGYESKQLGNIEEIYP